MKVPKRIEPLIEEGLVEDVICQLMSGKEALVYVVRCGQNIHCAKVYKEISFRSFRKDTDYTEGWRDRNSRRARAMEKGSRRGRKAQEDTWQSVEVDSLSRLAAIGVSVPQPYNFFEGVLLMELVTDFNGNAAPRLNDLMLTAELAREYHDVLIGQIIRMLCAGIVHGDLSEYNVLVGSEGLVIIDLQQAIGATVSSNARNMFMRDIRNLTGYLGRFAPELLATDYGSEIWSLYQSGKLHPDVILTGRVENNRKPVDVVSVMRVVNGVLKKEAAWQRYKQEMRG
jgi:RIO kinase 1